MVLGNLVALNYGGTQILTAPSFDPVESLQSVNDYGATIIYGVPTMFIAMLDEYEKNPHKYNIESLRTGFISGSGCPEALMHRIDKIFGIKDFTTGYGQTECSPVIYMCDAHDPFNKKAESVGRLLPMTESKIVNPETGKTVPWGEPGEVYVRGYLVMKGYWDDE